MYIIKTGAAEEAARKLDETSAQLMKLKEPASTLESARLSGATGRTSDSARDMGGKEQTTICRSVAQCILMLLKLAKAGNADVQGVWRLLDERGDLKRELARQGSGGEVEGFGVGSGGHPNELEYLRQVMVNIVQAYHVYVRQKDGAHDRQLLSLVANDKCHMPERMICELFSDKPVQLSVGDLVWKKGGGRFSSPTVYQTNIRHGFSTKCHDGHSKSLQADFPLLAPRLWRWTRKQ